MKNIHANVILKFQQLDVFKYATWEPRIYDHTACEQDVKEALQYHCPDHTYSDLLLEQLIELQGSGFVKICEQNHPYEIFEVFEAMARIINNKSIQKPFKNKRSFLYKKNIFHTHHSQAFYSLKNCTRYFEEQYSNDAEILKRIGELQRSYPDRHDYYALFAKEVFMQSLNWSKKTGEWLIYEKIENQVHFICLYVHNYGDTNDRKFYSFIKKYLLNDS